MVVAKLSVMAKQMVQIEELQVDELRNKTILEITEIGRLLRPLKSSASNLAKSLSSSIGGRRLSFPDIQTEVRIIILFFVLLSTYSKYLNPTYAHLKFQLETPK